MRKEGRPGRQTSPRAEHQSLTLLASVFLLPPCQAYLLCAIGLSIFTLFYSPATDVLRFFCLVSFGCLLVFILLFGGNRK